MVCSISNVTARFKPQNPLAAPHDKTDDPKAEDKEYPRFRPHPRRKRPRARDDLIDTFAKAIAARRQRLFVLSGKNKRFFGRCGDDTVRRLLDDKVAVVRFPGSERGCRTEQQGRKRAAADYQVPHHMAHIRFPGEPVNDAITLRQGVGISRRTGIPSTRRTL